MAAAAILAESGPIVEDKTLHALPDAAPWDTIRVPLRLRNTGPRPATVRGVELLGSTFVLPHCSSWNGTRCAPATPMVRWDPARQRLAGGATATVGHVIVNLSAACPMAAQIPSRSVMDAAALAATFGCDTHGRSLVGAIRDTAFSYWGLLALEDTAWGLLDANGLRSYGLVLRVDTDDGLPLTVVAVGQLVRPSLLQATPPTSARHGPTGVRGTLVPAALLPPLPVVTSSGLRPPLLAALGDGRACSARGHAAGFGLHFQTGGPSATRRARSPRLTTCAWS